MNLFNKFFNSQKESIIIYSPINGKVIPLSEIPDEAFVQRVIGDGCAIDPVDGDMCSPVNGTLLNIFPANHAVVIESLEGLEIIIHFGIDTVKLSGDGFKRLRDTGTIKVAEKIIAYDLEKIEKKATSKKTPIIINNMDIVEKIEVLNIGKMVKIGEPLMKVTLK